MSHNEEKAAAASKGGAFPGDDKPSLSQRFADAVTAGMGSWKFVIGQTIAIAAWIALNRTNILPIVPQFDPSLILMNLALSCEAAFAGAFILMSQNRQAQKDRQLVQHDYQVDLDTHRDLQELNRKIDAIIATIPPEKLAKALETEEPAVKTPANNNAAGKTAVAASVPTA